MNEECVSFKVLFHLLHKKKKIRIYSTYRPRLESVIFRIWREDANHYSDKFRTVCEDHYALRAGQGRTEYYFSKHFLSLWENLSWKWEARQEAVVSPTSAGKLASKIVHELLSLTNEHYEGYP
jgi:hypothetical protein